MSWAYAEATIPTSASREQSVSDEAAEVMQGMRFLSRDHAHRIPKDRSGLPTAKRTPLLYLVGEGGA